jgi:hypothetical protein
MEYGRDPCPWVILNDFGGAFCMGAVGGAIWHGVKGFRNSPCKFACPLWTVPCLANCIIDGERWIGSVTAMKARAPVLGGNFGVWGGLFSTYDCAVKGYVLLQALFDHPSLTVYQDTAERRSMERNNSGFLHRRIARRTRRRTSNAQRRNRLRYPPRSHRRRRYRIPEDDGRTDKARTTTDASTRRRRRQSIGVGSNILKCVRGGCWHNRLSSQLIGFVQCMHGEAQGAGIALVEKTACV